MSSEKNDWRKDFDKLYNEAGNFIYKYYLRGELKGKTFPGESEHFTERTFYEFLEAMGENIDEYGEG